MAKVLVQRVTFCRDVLPVPFCGVFGMRRIGGRLELNSFLFFFVLMKTIIIFLILFELCFNTQLLGGVELL